MEKPTRIIPEGELGNIPLRKDLKITRPSEEETFFPDKGEQTKLITVKGTLKRTQVGKGRKILVIIRTDRNYPQALGLAKKNWEFSECRLGGVDHEIYAVLLDFEDRPLFKSKSVNVRLLRR